MFIEWYENLSIYHKIQYKVFRYQYGRKMYTLAEDVNNPPSINPEYLNEMVRIGYSFQFKWR